MFVCARVYGSRMICVYALKIVYIDVGVKSMSEGVYDVI